MDAAPAFAVGERVRARNMSPRRAHQAAALRARTHRSRRRSSSPASVLPDTNAHFLGENPQYVYSVRFDSHELWGADAEAFTLTIELFESYLEEAA